MADRPKWTPRNFTCSVKDCIVASAGFHRVTGGKSRFFELPPGWFFSPIDGGVAFFCSSACTGVLTEGDAIKRFAWRVPCKNCGTSGMAMRINGARDEAVIAPPTGWSGFLLAEADDYARICLACSRVCLHTFFVEKLVPSPGDRGFPSPGDRGRARRPLRLV